MFSIGPRFFWKNAARKRHKRIYYEKMKLKMKEMEGKRGFMGRKVRTRLRWNAPVILTFVAICTGAFLCSFFTAGGANQLVFSVYRSSPTDPLTYLRLFTHVFGHAGWEHFSGNMVMILLLGPLLEEKYGSRNLIPVIALTALLTGLLQILLFPHTALLGASGIVYAFIILSSMTDMRRGDIPVTLVLIAGIYLGGQVYQGIFFSDHTANLIHVAGGVIGGVCGCRMQ